MLTIGVTAVVAGAVGVLGMSSSFADPAEAEADSVTFEGSCGLLGLLPSSEPNVSSLSVAKGTPVTYVNDLGGNAVLHVGQAEYNVDKGGSIDVPMERSAEVAMTCGALLASHDTATINVTAAPAEDESTGDSSGSSSGSSNSDDSDSNSDSSDNSSDDSDSSSDNGSDATNSDAEQADGTPPSASEADVPEPGTEPVDVNEDTEGDDEATSSDDDAAAGGNTGAETDVADIGDVEAIDNQPVNQGASGLLALIAVICLVGVGTAAVRTMVSNRSSAAA